MKNIPWPVKWSVGIVTGILLYSYLLLAGRGKKNGRSRGFFPRFLKRGKNPRLQIYPSLAARAASIPAGPKPIKIIVCS